MDESLRRASIGRRRFIARAGASLAALAAPSPLRAALPGPDDLNRLLGTRLPEPLAALLPMEVFEGASFIRRLMALEGEAKLLRLPPSRLSLREGSIPLDPERLYELALPRLVALIDRAELRNLGFADKAGELLALLHGTQHVTAEGYSTLTAPVAPLGFAAQELPDPGPIKLPPPDVPVANVPVAEKPAEAEAPPAGPITINRSLRFDDLAGEYADLFKAAELRPEHRDAADWHLAMMRQARPRYQATGQRAGVPWYFIAAIHGLEASFNFRAHFHNGDFPLTRRTRQVPAGRPHVWLPPSDWESSATDALRLLGFAGASDWSLPRILYRIEAFNGFGYRRLGRATPYLWSFSTNYVRGKFVADGKFNANARSQQCGAAVMLKLLADAGEIAFA